MIILIIKRLLEDYNTLFTNKWINKESITLVENREAISNRQKDSEV